MLIMQVAYSFAESMRAMGEANLHEPQSDITLVKLLECYEVSVDDQITGTHALAAI